MREQMHPQINFEESFRLVEAKLSPVEYRDPLRAPFADESRVTDAQKTVWDLMDRWEHKRDENGLWISQLGAIIGAKGAGKTHGGAAFAARKAQKFPGSMGCVVSNTYGQVKDNAIPAFEKVMRMLNLEAEFFNTVKINGRPYTKVYIIKLGGGKQSYMLVRSLDAVNLLEGVELDWLWVEEIQHSPKDAFVTAFSRVRGQNADRSVFIAGMSDSAFHWMYRFLPAVGFVEEDNYVPGEHRGILLEPNLYENVQNVGQDYIDRLMAIYDEEQAKMYVRGQRVSLGGNNVLPAYNDHDHRLGTRSRLLAKYDPKLHLYISIDFNVAPMTATLWQLKPWNDSWDGPGMFAQDGRLARLEEDNSVTVYSDPNDFEKANTEILAQVDEFEVWPDGHIAGTSYLMETLWNTVPAERYDLDIPKTTYAQHLGGITILGDATGNRGDTRSHTTDWGIIGDSVSENRVKHCEIIRGLEVNHNINTGEVKYSNPPRRDTINRLNAHLRNAKGEVRMCFLPESPLKSGGAARSCAMMMHKEDGTVDERVDRKSGRDVARTHPFDTTRYIVWHISGGSSLGGESFEKELSEAEVWEAEFGPKSKFFV